MRHFGPAMLACSLGACALFTNLDGLGPPGDGGGVDAAGDVTTDVTTDGVVATGFCASHPGHTFCEDFDDSGWAANINVSAAPDASGLDDAIAHSEPYAFVGTAASLKSAMVTKTFSLTGNDVVTVDVWLRVEKAPATNAIDTILQFVLTPNPPGLTGYHAGINQQGLQNDTVGFVTAQTDAGPTTFTTTALGANTVGNWRHFTAKLDRVAHTVTFEGMSLALLSDASIDSIQLQLGVAYTTQSSQTAHVDDILVDIGDGG